MDDPDPESHAEADPHASPELHAGADPHAETDSHAEADPQDGTNPHAETNPHPGTNPRADPRTIPDGGNPDGGDPDPRDVAVEHALSEVHPDRLEATVVGSKRTDEGLLVGVKADPRGFLSTAKYALVTVADDGRVARAEAVTGRELRRELGDEDRR